MKKGKYPDRVEIFTFLFECRFVWAYRKSRTRDPGCLQVGPRDPKMPRWDPGPQNIQVGPWTWDPQSGTWDPKIFK